MLSPAYSPLQSSSCITTHLELVRHHVPQPLVVHHPNVDVHRERLPRDAADHDLSAVAREARLLQQPPKLGVVNGLAAVAGLEGRRVHKLAAAVKGGWGRGAGEERGLVGREGLGNHAGECEQHVSMRSTAQLCLGKQLCQTRNKATCRQRPPPLAHVSAPALPVMLSMSMPMVMREGKACGLISRSGLRCWGGEGVGAWVGVGGLDARREGGLDAVGVGGGTHAHARQARGAAVLPPCGAALPAGAHQITADPHRMPVLSQKGMSTSSNRRDSTPFWPCRDANLSPGGGGGRGFGWFGGQEWVRLGVVNAST